ncbi:MAG: hypothetical protein GAK43_02570 [Stenotrophomonas maltophilia]|nr:MAG: hypothetical protein GAK43_02570 [Stenotrophomonas maltophilia]
MRPLTIDLEELAFALDTNGIDHYLDLGSGKVLLIPTEDPDPELAALLEEDPERLLYIEPLGAGESLTLMRDFLHDVEDPHAFTALDNALIGRKPFKAFRHVLMGYPELLQRWYDYQAERLRDCALDWLALNHIQPSPGARL